MQQQKMMLYLFPVIFAISGVNFPIGVLIYWLTTNIWSMGQQFFVIRRMPTPGSPAEKAYLERRARKGKPVPASSGSGDSSPGKGAEGEDGISLRKGQRVQPKRKDRQRRTDRHGDQSS
jgi:YidC/Oxa1 family membrane protein insertase